MVGHAAIKYADLSQNRTSDYVFSYDKMVALEGNTATYMQYSYARTQSIFAKGDVAAAELQAAAGAIMLDHPAEALGLNCCGSKKRWSRRWSTTGPNQLTTYLFALAKLLFGLLPAVPVLKAEGDLPPQPAPALRSGRPHDPSGPGPAGHPGSGQDVMHARTAASGCRRADRPGC